MFVKYKRAAITQSSTASDSLLGIPNIGAQNVETNVMVTHV